MKRYSRLGAVATAAALALSGTATVAQDAELSGSIRLAGAVGDQAGIEAVAAAFTEQTGVPVEMTWGDGDEFRTTLRTQATAGTAPDVFFVWPGSGNTWGAHVIAPEGITRDLSDLEFASRVPDILKAGISFDEQLVAAPIGGTSVGAQYNQTAMEANGWQIPTTWSEVLQLCADAQAAGKAAYGQSGGGSSAWNMIMVPYAASATLVYGQTPDFDTKQAAGETSFADSAWLDGMQKFDEMNQAGCFQENVLGTDWVEVQEAFANGDIMGWVMIQQLLPAIAALAPEGTELTMVPFPVTDDAADTRLTLGLGSSYGINAASENPDAATAFIDFLTSNEGAELYLQAAAGIPIMSGGDFELDPALTTILEFIGDGRVSPIPDQSWPNPRVQPALIEQSQAMFAGSNDAAGVLEAMDAAYAEGAG